MLFRRSFTNGERFFVLKIVDGLFIGNAIASQDELFLSNNKIKLIINCAPKQLKLHDNPNISIFEFPLLNNQGKILTSIDKSSVSLLLQKINQAHADCEGILICSKRGNSRALTCCLLYFMENYHWSLYKSLQFINSKRANLEVRANFLKLLVDYENSIRVQNQSLIKDGWEVEEHTHIVEKVLLNTYLNSGYQQRSPARQKLSDKEIKSKHKVTKKVKMLQKFQIIPIVQHKEEYDLSNLLKKRIKSQPIEEKFNLGDSLPIPTQNLNATPPQVRHHRRLSQKVLTQPIQGKQDTKITFKPRRKRSVTPIDNSRNKVFSLSLKQDKSERSNDQFPQIVQNSKQEEQSKKNILNLNINVSIKTLNVYNQNKINNFNRQKLKVYLNPSRKKSSMILKNRVESINLERAKHSSVTHDDRPKSDGKNYSTKKTSFKKNNFMS